jgi:hypothetical protein
VKPELSLPVIDDATVTVTQASLPVSDADCDGATTVGLMTVTGAGAPQAAPAGQCSTHWPQATVSRAESWTEPEHEHWTLWRRDS